MIFATVTSETGSLLTVALLLAIGVAVVVAIGELLARRTSSARWQRTLWRTVVLGSLAFAVAECTGITAGLIELAAVQNTPPPRPVRSAHPASADKQQHVPTSTPALRLTEQEFAPRFDQPVAHHEILDSTMTPPIASPPKTGDSPLTLASKPVVPARGLVTPARGTLKPSSVATNHHGDDPAGAVVVDGHRGLRWRSSRQFGALLVVGWLIVSFMLLVRMIWSRLTVARFCRKWSAVADNTLIDQVCGLSKRLGLRRRARLLEARQIATPIAFGIFRPTVVVPATFSTSFSRRQQRAMLAHELAHLASADAAWRLAADLLCALLWWHPLVWWSRRQLGAATERAADEASLIVPGGPRALASCLVAIGRQLVRPRSFAWQSVEGGGLRCGLARRVQSLLEMSNRDLPNRSWSTPRRGRLLLAGTALLMTLVILAVSCTAWARPRHTLVEGENSMRVLTNNWRRSVAAVAITAVVIPVIGSVVADDDDRREPAREVRRDGDSDRERGEADRPRREGEGDRERGEADRPRREGDRERGEGDRERAEGDRPRRDGDGERRDGDRERGEGDRPDRLRFEGDRPDRPRFEGDRPRFERERREGDDARRRELHERLEQLNRARAELEAKGRELQERLEKTDNDREAAEIKEAFGQLRREHEEIAHQIREISAALHGDRPEGRREVDRPRPDGGELERRIHHIHAAAENLRAAGLHDQARQLMEAAERLAQAHRERGESAHRPDRPDRPHPPGPPGEVQRLRGEVERLHRELNEIKGFIRDIVGEREGDERREREADREREGDERRERQADRPREGDRERDAGERRDEEGERDRPRRPDGEGEREG